MTDTTTEEADADADEQDNGSDVNISRLREMAIRGDQFRETFEFEYYGEEGELVIKPLTDEEFLPIAAFLENKLDLDPEEAQEVIEENKDEQGGIDPSQFDKEFVKIMQQAAAMGIDTTEGIAKGEDEEGVKEIVGMLQGGKSLIIAERVMNISSDAEKAEKFRRDGGSE